MSLLAANTPTPDRVPLLAALATAVPMLVVAGLWALMGLLGSNGMQGAKGAWFLFGHAGAGLLALLLAPCLAAWVCRRARRRGWRAAPAMAASGVLAIGVALLVLSSVSVALATLSTPHAQGMPHADGTTRMGQAPGLQEGLR